MDEVCQGHGGFAVTGGPLDYISPDGVMFGKSSITALLFAPGTDFPIGTGIPSFRLDIVANDTPGIFEIDSACFTPAQTLTYYSSVLGWIYPAFTAGIVTVVACDCPNQGDVNASGFPDAVDIAWADEILFHGYPDFENPACVTSRLDTNCASFIDASDLAILIDYVYFNGSVPCDPCEF